MEAFRPAGTDMTPAASLAVRAMEPVFKPVTWCLLSVASQG